MSIQWGSWDGHLRVGIDVSQNKVVNDCGDTSVTLTWKFYVQNDGWGFADPQTLNISGAVSDSINYNMNCSSGSTCTIYVGSRTSNKTTSYSGPVYSTVTATVSGAYNGATPSKSRTWETEQRPYCLPAVQTNFQLNLLSGDESWQATWTRENTSDAPYTSQTFAYKYDTDGSGLGSWQYVTISGTATSFTFNATQPAGMLMQATVRANNTTGSSSFFQPYRQTANRPKPPDSVTAGLAPGGSSINVTIYPPTAFDTSTTDYRSLQIERSVNGGAWTEVQAEGTVLDDGSGDSILWVDSSPGAGTNQYRVREFLDAAITNTGGAFSDTYTTSNTVTTIVAPLAPSNFQHEPAGTVDWNEWVTLTWQHNDGGDGAPQSGVQIDYSTNNGVDWTNLVDNSSWTNEWVIITSGFTNGSTTLFRVRTMGIASAGWGAWSDSESITGSTRPTATLQANNPPATVNTLPVPVEWAYQQDESSPQAGWEAKIVRTSDSVQVSFQNGTGTGDTTEFTGDNLVDGVTYDLSVRVLSGDGLWSTWDTQEITVDLLPPAAVTVDAVYDECTGTVALDITPDDPVTDVTVTCQAVKIERSISGVWVTLAESVTVPTTILDVLPITNADNTYRITSISDTPTYYENSPVVVAGTDGGMTGTGLWAFLNYGNGFQNVLRVRGYMKASDSVEKTNAVQPFSGRDKPVGFVGTNTSWIVSVEATAFYSEPCIVDDQCRYDSPPADWRAAAKEAEIVCFRDHSGRRLFGLFSGLSINDEVPGVATVSFTVTETDFVEVAGEVSEGA